MPPIMTKLSDGDKFTAAIAEVSHGRWARCVYVEAYYESNKDDGVMFVFSRSQAVHLALTLVLHVFWSLMPSFIRRRYFS